ncbi:tannase and feruloyl esterase [Colletotrichum musicola]|uniref:Carboxylic ester hydrolase n=1 Tax=Colletotrichum musicola TaxID=2175873 RepID=A0A8H6N085_9PEZI|nr:tannase and feruloyl esterase [Colletotrichum musicola]
MALSSITPSACAPATFPTPTLFGAEFLSLEVVQVTNYSSKVVEGSTFGSTAVDLVNANFCNVTVSYTHPGQNDIIHVETWLPTDTWNGKFNAVGGGGFNAGRYPMTYSSMAGALGNGYATVTTDAGLGFASEVNSLLWLLASPGNLNLYSLQNLASASLIDEALIAKTFIRNYYGQDPSRSYWTGCSQGGRQGLMLAQRYPDVYDGIIAAAPGLNWAGVMIGLIWPTIYMEETNQHPHLCEISKLTALAVSECDALDGVEDGIIADPAACRSIFDPFAHVGTEFECASIGENGTTTRNISEAAAAVADATWTGPVAAAGEPTYLHGVDIGTDLTSIVATDCSGNGQCSSFNAALVQIVIRGFYEKDPASNTTSVSFGELKRIYHRLRQELASSLGTNDPDLSEFRDAGGKMITFQGLADPTVPANLSLNYYRDVLEGQPDAHDFYRIFPIPGMGHCGSQLGEPAAQPESLFAQLRSWVENGTAPESTSYVVKLADNSTQEQLSCPYPAKAVFNPSAADGSSGWSCAS